MTNKQNQAPTKRKPSKRDRRNKIIIYIMILAMVGTLLTTGLAYIF